MTTTDAVRKRIRAARRSLSAEIRALAAAQLCERVSGLAAFVSARRIGAFIAFDGEMDPAQVVDQAWSLGRQVYLPIIGGDQLLRFARYEMDTPLTPNRFGIPEPSPGSGEILAPSDLDLVLTPLVAFDRKAHRIGMGGGFYDRSFSFVNDKPSRRRPIMLGVAYEIQRVEHIEENPWDVPLDGISTEQALYVRSNQTMIEASCATG